MDANLKIILDDYFEGVDKLPPSTFVHVRGNHEVPPMIEARFSETEPSTLVIDDDQELFEGDILVYPKTRQFCYVDDIRHIVSKGIYIVHYHTKYQRKAHMPFEEN